MAVAAMSVQLQQMFAPSAMEATFEGRFLAIQHGFSAGRLAIGAFAFGDYQDFYADCLGKLMELHGRATNSMHWNVSTQMRPFSIGDATSSMLDFSVPRTAADMPTVEVLFATCRSIWSWIERGGHYVAVINCHIDDLKEKVPMLLTCLALWSRQCDDVNTALRLAALQLGITETAMRAALPASCHRYCRYVDRVMATGRLPSTGRLQVDMLVGERFGQMFQWHRPGRAEPVQLLPLVQCFHRRRLLFSNAAAMELNAEQLHDTGMLRVNPAELPHLDHCSRSPPAPPLSSALFLRSTTLPHAAATHSLSV